MTLCPFVGLLPLSVDCEDHSRLFRRRLALTMSLVTGLDNVRGSGYKGRFDPFQNRRPSNRFQFVERVTFSCNSVICTRNSIFFKSFRHFRVPATEGRALKMTQSRLFWRSFCREVTDLISIKFESRDDRPGAFEIGGSKRTYFSDNGVDRPTMARWQSTY